MKIYTLCKWANNETKFPFFPRLFVCVRARARWRSSFNKKITAFSDINDIWFKITVETQMKIN